MVAKVAPVSYFRDMEASRKIGRPTIFKKGAMTAAERQRRRRRKLQKEKRAAEVQAKRERNQTNYAQYLRETEPQRRAQNVEFRRQLEEASRARLSRFPPLPNAGPADELARQIDEYMTHTGITLEDVRTALDHRFGPS
jgi:hypothetical protein